MPTFLVLGASGGTGRHFISLALNQDHHIKALVRTPSKLSSLTHPNLQIHRGSITDNPLSCLDEYLQGADYVVCMLGDAAAQKSHKINTEFVSQQLVPAMRRNRVKRVLYQAGGLSKPYNESMPLSLRFLRNIPGNPYAGQHADNEAVMSYLATEAMDIEWIVHRAGISGEGPKGVLRRSPNEESRYSVGTFGDCAAYNLKTVQDGDAVHTACLSCYG